MVTLKWQQLFLYKNLAEVPSAAFEIVLVMENVGIERITLMVVSQALWPRAQILYLPLPTDQLRTVNLQKCRKSACTTLYAKFEKSKTCSSMPH